MEEIEVSPNEQQHDYVLKALVELSVKCDKEGVDPQIVAQTLLSFAVTMAITCSDNDNVAILLDGIAKAVRRGEFTRDDA